MNYSRISDCIILDLPKIQTESGAITAINNNLHIPFETKRVYYLYDVPNRADRGGHAHKNLQQLVVAISGSFDIDLFDGIEKVKYTLNQPDQGLLIVPGIWRDLKNFSGGGICLVLASDFYNEQDYYRNLEEFIAWKS
jgi:dTDP-4-dehydrorhamnose 3,5-epimerase-like enzyme